MMFQFQIIGFVGDGDSYWGNRPVDITIYEINQKKAIEKAESIIGEKISTNQRKIIIKEVEKGGKL